MGKERVDDEKFLSAIQEPGQNGNVLNGGAAPILCEASGIYDVGPTFEVTSVKVLVAPAAIVGGNPVNPYPPPYVDPISGQTVIPELEAVEAANIFATVEAGENAGEYDWHLDGQLEAYLNNGNARPNWISAVASVLPITGDPTPFAGARLTNKAFNGVPVNICGAGKSRGGAEFCATLRTASGHGTLSGISSLLMLPVREECNGWLRYSFFSRSGGATPLPQHDGFMLESPGCRGIPLSAREIAIATGTVDWYPRMGRNLVITRSLGTFDSGVYDTTSRRPMLAPGLPKYCLFVHQIGRLPNEDYLRVPIHSECREHPQRILLNPLKPFHAQINNVLPDLSMADGTLDIWVKVLS